MLPVCTLQVIFRRILLHADCFQAEEADTLLSEPLNRVQVGHLLQTEALRKAIVARAVADKTLAKAAEEYKR